jgi:hypothetical protein
VNAKHTAKKMTKAGGQPVWEYRGVRIAACDGSTWGRGWIWNEPTGDWDYFIRYSTTLAGAKFVIDQQKEKGMN